MYIVAYVASVAALLVFSGTVHYVRRWNLHRRRQKKVDAGRVREVHVDEPMRTATEVLADPPKLDLKKRE